MSDRRTTFFSLLGVFALVLSLVAVVGLIGVTDIDITDLENAVSNLQSTVSDLVNGVSDLESNITDLRSDVADLLSNISVLESNVTDLLSNISVLESDVADLKSNITDLYKKIVLPWTTLVISGGEITVTQSFHKVDTEGGVATDDLDTINGGVDGMILILRSLDDKRDVTVREWFGNLNINGDFTLLNRAYRIVLQYDAQLNQWCELSRSH